MCVVCVCVCVCCARALACVCVCVERGGGACVRALCMRAWFEEREKSRLAKTDRDEVLARI